MNSGYNGLALLRSTMLILSICSHWVFLFSLGLVYFSNVTLAFEYEVKGSFTNYDHGVFKNTGQFEVAVRDSHWRIILTPVGATNKAVRTLETVDGRELIQMGQARPPRSAAVPPNFVSILPGPVPMGLHEPAFTHLWFMYASAAFLKELGTNSLPPIPKLANYPGMTRPSFPSQAVQIVLDEGLTKLPLSAVFLNSGEIQSAEALRPGRLSRPYNNGYTEGVYTSEDFREIGSLRLPGHVSYVGFQPNWKTRQSSNDLLVTFAFDARVESVNDKCPLKDVVPSLPKTFIGDDRRLPEATERAPSVVYSENNFKHIPTITELRDLKEATQKTKPAQLGRPVNMKAMALLGFSLLIPLALTVYINRYKKGPPP